MKIQRLSAFLTFFICLISVAFSQNFSSTIQELPDLNTQLADESLTETSLLYAEKTKQFETTKTKITITSNVSDAAVFLNGQFEGNTNLTLTNLPEGRYFLRVEKNGYEPKRYRISVKRGQEETYYVELKKYEGVVTFTSDPADTLIYVDGTRINSSSVSLEEGTHSVTARKFGYKNESGQITVFRNTYQIVRVTLEEAEFNITNFKANKTSFNPNLPGNPGQIKFSFSVTNKENGIFEVLDSSGKTVCQYQLSGFETWDQSFTWDGTTSSLYKIPDGVYTARISAKDQVRTIDFVADSSISIPFASVTASGTGIGTVPQAFHYPKAIYNAGLSAGLTFTHQDSPFYCAPFNAHFSYAFQDWLELSMKGGFLAGYEKGAGTFTVALKFTGQNKSDSVNFDYGFLIRAGGTSKKPYYPYGADNGAGVGGGLVAGFESKSFYTGLTSELTYKTSTYATQEDNFDSVWKNSLSLQYRASSYAIGSYASVHSSFGTTGLDNDDREQNDIKWMRALEGGVDICIQPFYSSFFLNLRFGTQIFKEYKYFKGEIDFSILL